MYKLIFIILLAPLSICAQTWQWGESGGSSIDNIRGTSPTEKVSDITTDINGNLYVLVQSVGNPHLKIAGVPKTTFGNGDIAFISFTCDGTLRWIKMIGGVPGSWSNGYLMKTDKKDGVYMVIQPGFKSTHTKTGTHNIYFDTDTNIVLGNTGNDYMNWKHIFVAKYDTSGNFKWIVSPEPDTVTSHNESVAYDIDVDSFGNIDLLCNLAPGSYGTPNSFVVGRYGTYILQYGPNGNLQGGVSPDMLIEPESIPYAHFKKDNYNKRYIICGTQGLQPVYIQNKKMIGEKYVGSFHFSGDLDWYRNDTTIMLLDGLVGRPALDDSGNIYVAGRTSQGKSFNGYTPIGRHSGIMIMKMDKRGNMLWASDPYFQNAVIGPRSIAIRNSGEVIIAGYTVGTTKWRTGRFEDSVKTPDAVYRPFFTRFNTQTGKLLGMEELVTDGSNGYPDYIIGDGRNNMYVGGFFKSRITVNGKNMAMVGGDKDFFVAKFGQSNCNCTKAPEPSFDTIKTSQFNYSFTYTGTPGTVIWDFGDGTTSTQQNPTHTYTWLDDFYACVTVTDTCGENVYCTKISTNWPTTINEVQTTGLKVYPNPTHDKFYLEGATPGSNVELIDIVGKTVYTTTFFRNVEPLQIQHLSVGSYIIQLTLPDGRRLRGKIVKQ